MKQNSSIIFFEGAFIPEEDAVVSIKTHALHYGTGVFEGIRSYYNIETRTHYAFRMKEHYERLMKSCKIMHLTLPHTVDELCEITSQLIQKNFHETDLYIRPLVYKSDHAVGNFNLASLKTAIAIYATPLGRHLNSEEGLHCGFTSWERVSSKSIPPRGKITGSYANTSLAHTEARESGYDEALFLDGDGNVVEGSAENIFVINDGEAVTPPTTADILVGITRNTVIELLEKELQIRVHERSLTPADVLQANEVILVGTGAEIKPVLSIDKKQINDGKVGTITLQIMKLYDDIVHGRHTDYQHYLTKISR